MEFLPPEFIIHDNEIIFSDESLGSGGAGTVVRVKLVGRFGGINAAMKTIPVADQVQVEQANTEVQTYVFVVIVDN